MRVYWSDMKTLAYENNSIYRTPMQKIRTIRVFIREKRIYDAAYIRYKDYAKNNEYLQVIFSERKKQILKFIAPSIFVYDPNILLDLLSKCSVYSSLPPAEQISYLIAGKHISGIPIENINENPAEVELLKSLYAIS